MSSPKILVADDSVTIQKVIRLALSHEGYEIRGVSTEAELLEQIALFQPHIIILDSSLSGKSAFDIKEVIDQNAPENLKFILMSNTFEVIDDERFEMARFHARLTKPFDPAQLRETIEALFQTKEEEPMMMENNEVKPFHEESDSDSTNIWTISESAKKGLLNNIQDKDEELNFEIENFNNIAPQLDPTESTDHFSNNEIDFNLDLKMENEKTSSFQSDLTSEFEARTPLKDTLSEKEIKTYLEAELKKLAQKLLPEIAERVIKEEINRLLDQPPNA